MHRGGMCIPRRLPGVRGYGARLLDFCFTFGLSHSTANFRSLLLFFCLFSRFACFFLKCSSRMPLYLALARTALSPISVSSRSTASPFACSATHRFGLLSLPSSPRLLLSFLCLIFLPIFMLLLFLYILLGTLPVLSPLLTCFFHTGLCAREVPREVRPIGHGSRAQDFPH